MSTRDDRYPDGPGPDPDWTIGCGNRWVTSVPGRPSLCVRDGARTDGRFRVR